jgi:hypothetical protein
MAALQDFDPAYVRFGSKADSCTAANDVHGLQRLYSVTAGSAASSGING